MLDAGALLALERDDRRAWQRLAAAVDARAVVQVPAGVIAQTWRDGRRQARLSRALEHCHELPLDGRRARAAGLLCGATGTTDIVDAAVAVAAATLAQHGPTAVVTSDPGDIERLLGELGSTALVVGV